VRASAWLVVLTGCGPVVGASDDESSTGSGRTTSSGSASTLDATTVDPSVDPTTVEPSGPDDATIDIKMDMTGGDECSRSFVVEPLPSQVFVLVDASQTMTQPIVDHDLDPDTPPVTRWSMLATALEQYVPLLVEQSSVDVWAFPRFDAEAAPDLSACEIDASHAYLGSTAAQIFAYLPDADATDFLGATPTTLLLSAAHSHLTGEEPGPSQHIVVITDGAPNCYAAAEPPATFDEVDENAADWAAYAASQGIATHVVAVAVPEGVFGGGPEGDAIADHRAALEVLAEAGGTTLLSGDDVVTMGDAMNAVVRATASCRLVVPRELGGLPYAVEIGDGRVYYEVPIELCADNWGFARVSGDGEEEIIEMCGGACASLVEEGVAEIVEICVIAE
jgi:hypothetical protein